MPRTMAKASHVLYSTSAEKVYYASSQAVATPGDFDSNGGRRHA